MNQTAINRDAKVCAAFDAKRDALVAQLAALDREQEVYTRKFQRECDHRTPQGRSSRKPTGWCGICGKELK